MDLETMKRYFCDKHTLENYLWQVVCSNLLLAHNKSGWISTLDVRFSPLRVWRLEQEKNCNEILFGNGTWESDENSRSDIEGICKKVKWIQAAEILDYPPSHLRRIKAKYAELGFHANT